MDVKSSFTGAALRPSAIDQIAKIGAIVASHPGLRVEVEGHMDAAGSEALSAQRADAVREILIRRGVSANAVMSRGLGNSRPISSSATPSGREENQRVEIILSGEAIGSMPFWDRTYPLKSGPGQ